MHLFPALKDRYTKENLSAREAQRMAQMIAWGPVVFQASRVMLSTGIMGMLRDGGTEGLTQDEVVQRSHLSPYAVKCLLEASLSIGTVLVDDTTDRYTLSKTGWFLLTDDFARVNMDFNHDVNYEGWFRLEESLKEGRPAGLEHFGSWPTIYEGLSSLPEQVQKSWFGFDHFYSDASFPEALQIVFGENPARTLYDVGGNTGKWALKCVEHNAQVQVTVLDLPGQIAMLEKNIQGKPGAERIDGYGINLLDMQASFPRKEQAPDAIWMSQFLDCFSMDEIVGILSRAREVMDDGTRLYIMETLWDRQKYETAAFCLTMTSLYFTALANGNSKMYNTQDMQECIDRAGLRLETIHDGLGHGHSIMVCRR